MVQWLTLFVEMASGGEVEPAVNLDKAQSDIGTSSVSVERSQLILPPDKLWELVNSQPSITPAQKAAIKSMYSEVIKSLGHAADSSSSSDGFEHVSIAQVKGTRQRRDSSKFLRPNVEDRTEVEEAHLPFLHLKRRTGTSWAYSQKLTNICE